MTKQFAAVGTVALITAFATLTLSVPAHAGRMLDLVAKPAQADAVSIARGNSSLRASSPAGIRKPSRTNRCPPPSVPAACSA